MYYLQSRYYDPALGRFINADVFTTTDADGLLSCNMFAYCENDPVNKNDPTGELLNAITGAVVGALFGGISSVLSGESFWVGAAQGGMNGLIAGASIDAAIAIVGTGGLGAIAVAAGISAFGGALGSIIGDQTKSLISRNSCSKINWKSAGKEALINVASFGVTATLKHMVEGAKGFNTDKSIKGIVKSIFKPNNNKWGWLKPNSTDVLSSDYGFKLSFVRTAYSHGRYTV